MAADEFVPTQGMGGDEFEAFFDALLLRMRFLDVVPHLISHGRHGVSGQKQDGIDFFGEYDDGTTATWQCKDWLGLSETQVGKVIADTAVQADRHVLAFAGIAGAHVRTLINGTPSWQLWDQRDLSNLVRSLPIYQARTLLDHHFGSTARNRFLPLASADVFLGLEQYFEPLLSSGRRFHHSAEVVGRNQVVGELTEAILNPKGPSVVVLDAPGGRGKSRTALEVLRRVIERRPFLPVLVVNDRRIVDAAALGELPNSEAVILIEDAHRDPDGIATALQHARSTPGVKVLLTTRPSAGDQVRRSVKTARFDGTEILDVSLEPLTLAASRELVAELVGDGPTLPAAFVEALAREARATPLIAVLAVGMISRGELSAALSVDANFRQEVLDRYGDVLTDGVEGIAPAAARAVLALVAALGPLDVSDVNLIARMAEFLGRPVAELLEDLERLVDHGVLLQRGGLLRVVPDVVADEVLRHQAVRLGQSTGYVQKLWDRFSDGYIDRLLKSLADLDWQLRSRPSHPYPGDVFDGVWSAFREWLFEQDSYDRTMALGWLAPLAYTQPARVVEVVSDLLDSPGEDATTMWGRTFTQQEVSSACPRLLSSTLVGAPALIETVLDLLWRLAKADTRDTAPRSDHPFRVLCALGDLAEHPTNGPTVIGAVRQWLTVGDTEAVRSPLEVLTPLVSKEGTTHTWIPHAIQMRAYLIDPVAVRGVRDEVRDTVREAVRGASVARVLAAVSLLETALRPPHGFFGEPVQVDAVTQWEADDLATIQVLAEIAAEASEPLVRLRVRDAVASRAERAETPAVRVAAADLARRTTLPGDRLTDILRTGSWDPLPDVQGWAAAPDGPQAPPTTEGVEDDFAARQARRREQEAGAVAELLAGDAVTTYERLRERADAVAENGPGLSRLPGLASLLEVLFADDEPAARAFCAWIGTAEPSPLDGYVSIPLRAMLVREPESALTVLRDLLGSRRTLALGALEVFRRPVPQAPGVSEVLLATLGHEDPELAAAALAYLGPSLRENVGAFAAVLRGAAHDHAHQVAYALESATEHDSPAWVEALTQAEADDICSLLELLPDWSYSLQMLVSAVAAKFPDSVLSLVTARAVGEYRAPHEVIDLGAALSASPNALFGWLRSSSRAWDVDTSESWMLQVLCPLLAGTESYENGRPQFQMSDGALRAR